MEYTELCKPGIHFLREPIRPQSGTVLKAEQGSRIIGGIAVHPANRGDGVWVCDLPDDYATFVSRGFGRKEQPSHNELFWNGRPMRISRYPAEGFLTITSIGVEMENEWKKPCGKLDGGFYYDDPRPLTWDDEEELWVHGYWSWDWSPTREKIAKIDKKRGFILTEPPYGQYSFRVGQRFSFFNIVEEVHSPGEYALDFRNKKIYCIPPVGETNNAEVLLSCAAFPAFELDNVHDVTIEGFTVECFRGKGITIDSSKNVMISKCEFRNIGNTAVDVNASEEVHIIECCVHDTGDAGIRLTCGDRTTLTPAACSVEKCHIYSVANWDRTYQPPINLSGVGLSAKGNMIHDCPHTAILFGGNDISITDNEIWNVVTETGDAGAIYAGRDYTYRGNEVSRNFIHHVGSGIGMGTMGIYNDDCLSGTVMADNVFYRVQRAVFLGGGVDFLVKGNIFIDCSPSVEIDGRGQSPSPVWRNMIEKTMHDRFYNIAGKGISAAEPPYSIRYPELKKIDNLYRASSEPLIPPSARIEGNFFCSDQKIHYTWNTEGGTFVENDNCDITREQLRQMLTPHQTEIVFDSQT